LELLVLNLLIKLKRTTDHHCLWSLWHFRLTNGFAVSKPLGLQQLEEHSLLVPHHDLHGIELVIDLIPFDVSINLDFFESVIEEILFFLQTVVL
jgi:hypothetical protein